MEKELTIEKVQLYVRNTTFELHSTHGKLSFPIICRIYNRLRNGRRFDAINVDEDIIIDGHHRYIAHHILGIKIESKKSTKGLSTESIPWNQVIIVLDDWDMDGGAKYE